MYLDIVVLVFFWTSYGQMTTRHGPEVVHHGRNVINVSMLL